MYYERIKLYNDTISLLERKQTTGMLEIRGSEKWDSYKNPANTEMLFGI